MDRSLYNEILDDLTQLVRNAAHPKRKTLRISPDTLALLESLGVPKRRPDAPRDVESDNGLDAVKTEVASCTKCRLCETRTQTVFSDGNPRAKIVFVGEAPGEQEDRQGVPFVGRAGQLLTDIIEKGMNLDRQRDTYICNVVKCRPPENRNPDPEEMRKCEPYLVRQLELIKPQVIVALGGVAAKALLNSEETVGRLRGRWHEYRSIPLRVTYHPAYLLRSPNEKRKTWDDIQEVMKFLSGETRLNS